MKFADLRPGEEFEFAGKTYRKSGPLTASPLDGDGSVMVPRSASVTLRSSGVPPVAEAERSVSSEDLAQAIEAFYRVGLQTAQRHGDEPAAAELAALRRHWLARLGSKP